MTHPPKTNPLHSRGHQMAQPHVRTHHCTIERERWPWWLMFETRELIDEVLDYDPDNDDDGHDGVNASVG